MPVGNVYNPVANLRHRDSRGDRWATRQVGDNSRCQRTSTLQGGSWNHCQHDRGRLNRILTTTSLTKRLRHLMVYATGGFHVEHKQQVGRNGNTTTMHAHTKHAHTLGIQKFPTTFKH